ncbi:MAG: putative sugar nucleotidyl transferase, partial [Phycisphaerales bacterium]
MSEPRKSILFNDAKGILSPLNDLRPAHAIRTGAMTTAERLTHAFNLEPIGIVVPHTLKEITEDQSGVPVNEPPADTDEPILMINGRCPLPIQAIGDLKVGEVAIEKETSDMIAVCLKSSDVRALLSGGNPEMNTIEIDDTVLMKSPWDWRAFRDRCIEYDLSAIIPAMQTITEPPTGVMILGTHGVAIHPEAVVMPGVILNSELGPIVIEENATIRPGTIITGPAYIGPGTTVLEQANIKPNTAIG